MHGLGLGRKIMVGGNALPVPDELLGSSLQAVITADGASNLARKQHELAPAGDGRRNQC
jgi:hypothetical protein